MDTNRRTKTLMRVQRIEDVKNEIRNPLYKNGKNQKILKEYKNCCLCGHELVFNHVTNFVHLEVLEEAHCSNCNIRNKKEFHRLQ